MTSQLRVSNEPAPFKALDDIIHVSMMSSSPSRDPDSPSSTAPKSMTPTRRKSIMSFSGDDKEDAEDWYINILICGTLHCGLTGLACAILNFDSCLHVFVH